MARNTIGVEWTDTIFTQHKCGDLIQVTVPRNIEDFRTSTMMMSILKIFEIKGWIPVLSQKDLPAAVLETKEGAFFAGFVSGATRQSTGELETGSSKYTRGIRAFQTYTIERTYGKPRHLRTGGLDSLNKRLSDMKGFTNTYWGLRSTITSLFKTLPKIPVDNLETFVRSKEELLKTIKTRLACENGGCYRPEELRYLSGRYSTAKGLLSRFLTRIERPDAELANSFDELYAPVKIAIDAADNEIKANLASRARILFPNDNKKKSQIWAKKPLTEKLLSLPSEKQQEFLPESLPGIQALPIPIEGDLATRNKALQQRYKSIEDPSAQEVVTSWYANYDSSLEDE
jgi:hypothetical protein